MPRQAIAMTMTTARRTVLEKEAPPFDGGGVGDDNKVGAGVEVNIGAGLGVDVGVGVSVDVADGVGVGRRERSCTCYGRKAYS